MSNGIQPEDSCCAWLKRLRVFYGKRAARFKASNHLGCDNLRRESWKLWRTCNLHYIFVNWLWFAVGENLVVAVACTMTIRYYWPFLRLVMSISNSCIVCEIYLIAVKIPTLPNWAEHLERNVCMWNILLKKSLTRTQRVL